MEAQLSEKIAEELSGGQPYEALQYVQSFIARKRKTIGPRVTSNLVFLGVNMLVEHLDFSYAGTLLVWFIEGGAGEDKSFRIERSNCIGEDQYCDIKKLFDVLNKLSAKNAFEIVDKVNPPLNKILLKAKISIDTPTLKERLTALEILFANAFEAAGKGQWHNAFQSAVKVGDMGKAAGILNQWASEGYAMEFPMFFARAALDLLALDETPLASQLVAASMQYIDEDKYSKDGIPYATLSAWHFTVMLTELLQSMCSSVTGIPARCNRQNIFTALYGRYRLLLVKVDPKLVELVETIKSIHFQEHAAGGAAGGGPLDMIQGMLNGNPGGPDLRGMMNMFQGMQQGRR